MKQGAWHQFGDRSQKLALEQLQDGCGVGAIVSPRDLAFDKAKEYAPKYHETGAEVLIDQQFFLPESDVGKLRQWPCFNHRGRTSSLAGLSQGAIDALATSLEEENRGLKCAAILAPAVTYAAGRRDIAELNSRLFSAARKAGDTIGVPTLATVFLGDSAAASYETITEALSAATSLGASGWYFAFQFGDARLPADDGEILRYCAAALKLAATGLPVLHGYAGPIAPVSLATGATGVGVCHSQNTWGFSPSRWKDQSGGGGGGDAPPRFFSPRLWGTIVYPDEFARLPEELLKQIVVHSAHSSAVSIRPPRAKWSRWDANKHLVATVCAESDALSQKSLSERVSWVVTLLEGATSLHSEIARLGVELNDHTADYQQPWLDAVRRAGTVFKDEYEVVSLLASL